LLVSRGDCVAVDSEIGAGSWDEVNKDFIIRVHLIIGAGSVIPIHIELSFQGEVAISSSSHSIAIEKVTMETTPNPKSPHPKGKTTNLKKPPPKPPPISEKPTLSQENTTRTTMSQENTARTTRQNSNMVYKTFDGTAGDEKGMLRNTIQAITSTTKNPFVKRLAFTNMRKR
jgi:hypothetical protein